MDLVPLPMEKENLEGKQRAEFVKSLHEKVKAQIKKKILQCEKQTQQRKKASDI